MLRIGIEVLAPQTGSKIAPAGNRVFPDLLRKPAITGTNSVWALDTAHIPMPDGTVYFSLVVSVATRRFLAHMAAISVEITRATEEINRAFASFEAPELVNIDPGGQFTWSEFNHGNPTRNCRL